MRKNLMLSLLFGILIMGFIFLPAARADDSCWESTETNPGGSELISKVENPVHCVFDDDPSPYDTYESYPIWVYGRDFNVVAYTNIRVKIYVKAFFHIDFYYFGQKVGESENWGSATESKYSRFPSILSSLCFSHRRHYALPPCEIIGVR